MTLDEAIKHAEEVADFCEYEASKYDMSDSYESHVACQEGMCAKKHRQLAEYLKDYKRLLEQEPKTEQFEKTIDAIDFAIEATDSQDDYGMGMRNGMRYVKSLIDGKEPQYELRGTDEEIKLGINLGDEVIGDFGAKGVVVGIDTYKGEVLLSLMMRNHKVPQLVKAFGYKTKTGRHFPQIVEVLEQMKGEADGK